jgi:PAS domain S-box-containing protein
VLLQAMSEGALTLADDGIILYANLRFAGLVGVPHERVVGASFAGFVHEPDRRRFEELLGQQGGSTRADLALSRPDGVLVLCVVSMSRVDGAGTWAVVVTDVTLERTRAQDDLSAQKEWLHGALSSIDDAVITTDGHGLVTFMNRRAASLTGWETGVGEPIQNVLRLVNAETRDRATDSAEQVLGSNLAVGLADASLLIARDGTERPIDGSAAPISDAKGRALGVILVFRDISGRKHAEETVQRRSAAEIAYLLEKTEKILDNIPTGVLALSDTEIAVAANRVLRERMPPTALGAPLSQAFPEAPSTTILRLRQLIEQTRRSSQVQSLFGAFLTLFGEEERYNVHVVPLEPRFPDTRFLLVIEDLSEVHALEGQLLRAEKLATVGVLSAGIVHEVGTPLGVIRGRAEYILAKLGLDHPQARGVQVIIEQIDHVTARCGCCSTSHASSRRRCGRSRRRRRSGPSSSSCAS